MFMISQGSVSNPGSRLRVPDQQILFQVTISLAGDLDCWKVCLFKVCIICSTVYPVFRPDIRLSGQPDIRQIKPDTRYKKGRISGRNQRYSMFVKERYNLEV